MAYNNSDNEPAENEIMIDGKQILEIEQEIWRCCKTFVPFVGTFKFRNGFHICCKSLTKWKEMEGDLQEASRREDFENIAEHVSETEVEYFWKANLFWSQFWKQLPTKLEDSEAILAVETVRMKQNPCSGCCVQILGMTGTTCQYKEHRLHNLGKSAVRSQDPEATVSLGMVGQWPPGHACHNMDKERGLSASDVIDVLLNPALVDKSIQTSVKV